MRLKTLYLRKPGRVDGPEPFPFDWESWDDDTYSGELGEPYGFGPSEHAAIDALMDVLEEAEDFIAHDYEEWRGLV